MATTNGSNASSDTVPEEVLLTFFFEATKALESCSISQPLTMAQCRDQVLQQQTLCLDKVVNYHKGVISSRQLQDALSKLSSQQQGAAKAMQDMTDAARLALARLVLTSVCLRTNTTTLNESPSSSSSLKTSRMTRSDILEFCALCRASVRLETVLAHLRDPTKPLLEQLSTTNSATTASGNTIPLKRLENLQRLLLQAMEYDADMGLMELARHVQANDDQELVQVIQQTTAFLMDTVLGIHSASPLLSDQDQGGVTRVVSVQHSEKIIQLGGNNTSDSGTAVTTAPRSQSMREEEEAEIQQQQHFQMAQKAAALRESLVNELEQMSDHERTDLLQHAEQALLEFQQKATELPVGPERIAFLTSMDSRTQRLLAMHRIWQEEQLAQGRASQAARASKG
jgi:hypothetical protein